MQTIKFTNALKRFYPTLDTIELDQKFNTVNELLQFINTKHPGIINYIVDDQGVLRKHVNIFINGDIIKDRMKLSDILNDSDEVYFIQALSGG